MAGLHILKNSHQEAIVKVYTTSPSGETIDISLQNTLTLPTEVYVTGTALTDESVDGGYSTYTGSHVIITGIWWGAKDGKQVDILRKIDAVPTYHNHYYLIGANFYDFKASGFADRVYANKDITVSFVGGEGHCILRLSKMGWNQKIELPQFSVYDNPNVVGS